MKKIILASMFAMSLSAAFSQFEKGSNWIGGLGNFSLDKSSQPYASGGSVDQNSFSFGTNLSYNHFKSDKVIKTYFIGYNYTASSLSNPNPYFTNNNGYSVSLGFGRIFVNPLFGKVYSTVTTNFFGQYSFSNSETINNSGPSYYTSYTKGESFSLNFNFNLGLLYKINNKFAISTSVNNIFNAGISTSSARNGYTGGYENEIKRFTMGGGFGLDGFTLNNLQFGFLYKLK